MKTFTLIFCLTLATKILTAQPQSSQDPQDSRVVGIVDFSSGLTQDSIAAKNVNSAVARVLVQTQRFTILDVPEWKKTQEEIDRQKGDAFMDNSIITKGKTLGAKVLVIGHVDNAEIYQDGANFSARVDYDVKFVDVESGKSIAANSFKGESESLANKGAKASKVLTKLAMGSYYSGKGNWQKMYFTSAAFSALSETDKNAIKGKMIDAINNSAGQLNAWVRGTFGINLLCLSASDEDGKKGFQHVLVEGGDDINMIVGDQLTLVIINQIQTARGKIQDEVPVADLEVEEVRAQTSLCKVVGGGKKISGDPAQINTYRVIFKQKK